MNIDDDLEFISNSLRMLPPWDWDAGGWWPQFGELAGRYQAYLGSKDYLTEKMAWITAVWQKASMGKREAAGDRPSTS